MILNDIQIRERCVAPVNFFDLDKYNAEIHKQDLRGWPLGEHAAATMKAHIQARCTRKLSDEKRAQFPSMIAPFINGQIRKVETGEPLDTSGGGSATAVGERKIISKGLTSYGYDVALSDREVKIFTNINATEIDPKRLDSRCLVDAEIKYDVDGAKYVTLPPNSYLLGHTVEYFRMPRDLVAVCLGKSTYARAGVLVNVTPIEPGFEGNVVIEVGNSTGLPVRIYLNEGISQFLFLQGDPCEVSYADRGGKYQGQTGVTLPRV